METQSTVTDSAFSQVEQALLEPVPPQREVTPAEAPVEPPVAIERDEESGARVESRLDVEDLDAVGEVDEEVLGPSGLRLEVVVPSPPQVTVTVPRAPRIDLVDAADDAMINAVHRRIVEARGMLENKEMTDVEAGRKYVQLADAVVRSI